MSFFILFHLYFCHFVFCLICILVFFYFVSFVLWYSWILFTCICRLFTVTFIFCFFVFGPLLLCHFCICPVVYCLIPNLIFLHFVLFVFCYIFILLYCRNQPQLTLEAEMAIFSIITTTHPPSHLSGQVVVLHRTK